MSPYYCADMRAQSCYPHWWSRSGGVAISQHRCRSHTCRNPSVANPAHRRRTPRQQPSTHQQTFQLQPSPTIISNAQYVTYHNVKQRGNAPRPWGMQPNTSFRFCMCISPLMFVPYSIPFPRRPIHRLTMLLMIFFCCSATCA